MYVVRYKVKGGYMQTIRMGQNGFCEDLIWEFALLSGLHVMVLKTELLRFCVPYAFFGNKRTAVMVVVFVGPSVRCYYRLNRGI